MKDACRILVVDDNPTNRLILRVPLQKAGYEVLEAVDGNQAVDTACRQLPDLVLLDVCMPHLDGFEVCKVLKARQETASIPVIFITARTETKDIEQAFAVGGSDYVTKPFRLGEVKARVSVHLQLRQSKRELQEAHVELLQAQKLEAIGQLAAGIAHEINTPAQYIGDNTTFLQRAFEDFLPLIARARELAAAARTGAVSPDLLAAFDAAVEEADLEYVTHEAPKAFRNSLDGIKRVTGIVQAIKEFSHPGAKEKTDVDVNRSIESTVIVATSEWKYVADVETDLERSLPLVSCEPGELNQVILNLVVNAAHAIAAAGQGGSGKGKIRIRTRRDGDSAEIRIADTGTGIAPEIRHKIFDPFFTTKEVGKGTGQGLFIAHNIVVQKHGGTIGLETEVGKGTTFVIRLPIALPKAEVAA